MLRLNAVIAAIALYAAAPAFAHSSIDTPRIDSRQANQHARIQNGLRSGELTRHEYAHLAREQAHIRRMEVHAKADGVVSPQERHRLLHAQQVHSRHIYREKHDAQQRHVAHDGYRSERPITRRRHVDGYGASAY